MDAICIGSKDMTTDHLFEPLADTPDRAAIRDGVRAICEQFDD